MPAKLLHSYLSNRSQATLVNGFKSISSEVKCGVPQGSILGPLLFLIYINDLARVSSFDIRLFADDACLILDDKNPKRLQNNINHELNKINNWMKINKLSINYDKTNYMIFTKKRNDSNFCLQLDGHELQRVTNAKYLGVILNDKLNWTSHINNIYTKISKASYILCKIRHYVNLNTLKMIYYSLVYPHLTYCISSWGGAPKTTLQSINRLHNKILRIITFSDFKSPSAPLYFKLQMLTITDIYNLKLATLIHNIHNHKFTGSNNLVLLQDFHSYQTRLANSNNFFQQFTSSNLTQSTFSSAGLRFWRSLPNDIKLVKPSAFKYKVKYFLLNKYNNS